MRALILVLLSGCGSSFLDERNLACEYNPHDWFDSPTMSVMNADKDGVFEFDPPGAEVINREGTYDFETGDFAWVDTYDSAHYLVRSDALGYGTIYGNGDIDLLYTIDYLDVLSDEWGWEIRTERTGCSEIRTITESPTDAQADAGSELFQYEQEWNIRSDTKVDMATSYEDSGVTYDSTATLTSDLEYAFTSVQETSTGRSESTGTSHGDGTAESDYQGYEGTVTWLGQQEDFFDGSYHDVYDVWENDQKSYGADMTWTYEGAGQGTYYQYGEYELECGLTVHVDGSSSYDCDDGCTYNFSATGACTYDCGSSGSGSC